MSDLNGEEKKFLDELENEMKHRYDGENDPEFSKYLNETRSVPPLVKFEVERKYWNNNNNSKRYNADNDNNYRKYPRNYNNNNNDRHKYNQDNKYN